MNNLELGERVHRQLEHLLNLNPWQYVPDIDDRERLRSAGIKSKKRYYDLKPYVVPVFPRWAVELLDHPQCSKRVLNGALKNIKYRKMVLMETRLCKQAQVRRREQQATKLLCHQTAVQPKYNGLSSRYNTRDAQATYEAWKKLWPEMERTLCGNT